MRIDPWPLVPLHDRFQGLGHSIQALIAAARKIPWSSPEFQRLVRDAAAHAAP